MGKIKRHKFPDKSYNYSLFLCKRPVPEKFCPYLPHHRARCNAPHPLQRDQSYLAVKSKIRLVQSIPYFNFIKSGLGYDKIRKDLKTTHHNAKFLEKEYHCQFFCFAHFYLTAVRNRINWKINGEASYAKTGIQIINKSIHDANRISNGNKDHPALVNCTCWRGCAFYYFHTSRTCILF